MLQNEEKNNLFTVRSLAVLVLPLMVEQFLGITVGLADNIMISSAGEAAVSGISLVDMVNNLMLTIVNAFATGGAVVCSQYTGSKKPEQARRAAGQLLLVMITFALIFMGIMLIFGRSILTALYGASDVEVMEAAFDYATYIYIAFPFFGIYGCCAAIFRSMGDSKSSMRIALLMNVINVIGNAILIYGFNMGAGGAAIATMGARAIGAAIMLIKLRNRENPIYLRHIRDMVPSWFLIKKILQIGVPSGIDNSLFNMGKVIVLSFITTFGTASIMANQVASNVSAFMLIPGNAVSLALITVVGQCIGAGRIDEARTNTRILMAFSTAAGLLIGGITVMFSGPLLGVFHMSQISADISGRLILYHTIANLIWAFAFNLPNSLRAGNDARFVMLISIASMWIFRVGLSYVLGVTLGLGVYGVWFGMFTDWVARGMAFFIRYRGSKWYSQKLI